MDKNPAMIGGEVVRTRRIPLVITESWGLPRDLNKGFSQNPQKSEGFWPNLG